MSDLDRDELARLEHENMIAGEQVLGYRTVVEYMAYIEPEA